MNTGSSSKALDVVRPDILEMLGYEPIEPPELLAKRLGLPPDRIVKLDANENPYGPSRRVVQALAEFQDYHRYPDPKQRRLREAIAGYAGVPPDQVVAGHGSDELIDIILRVLIAPADGVIDCPPTFGMYRFLTRVAGGRCIEVPRLEDFSLDAAGITEAAQRAKVAFITSPNNPTGNPLDRAQLDHVLATGIVVVVDEAYAEFAGGSVAPLVGERDNLIVLRTFSKWAGLAGLRAGYGIMPPALANVIMETKQPYTPNVAAEVAMLASIEDREALMETVQALVHERERLARKLGALEFIAVFPSKANFVLCRLGDDDDMDARDVHRQLASQGVFVRHFDTPRLRDCLRVSAGRPGDTDRLVGALKEIGGERAR